MGLAANADPGDRARQDLHRLVHQLAHRGPACRCGVVRGKKVASNIRLALVVPGSGLVKRQAEREGLDEIFRAAGFEWREPGCSMCLAMNADRLEPASAARRPRIATSRGARAPAAARIWSARRWPRRRR
jgi:hypothetical protein